MVPPPWRFGRRGRPATSSLTSRAASIRRTSATPLGWRAPSSPNDATRYRQSVRLEAAIARLERQEFEVATWQAFYVERAPLGAWLHEHADCLLAALREFPGDEIVLREGARPVPRYVPLLWNVEGEWSAFATALRAAMAEHVEAMGDMHAAIERALDDAGADWRGYRPAPPKGMTRDSSWEEPATMAQAERRRAAATAALERMKVAMRRGDLLAAWPAERVVGRLVIGWRTSVIEQFGVRHAALVLTKVARPVNHSTQWQLFTALQGILKGVVCMAEHAVGGEEHDAHSDMRARFLPVIRSIALYAGANRPSSPLQTRRPGFNRASRSRSATLRPLMTAQRPALFQTDSRLISAAIASRR